MICNVHRRDDGPWYRCTRKAVWTLIGRRGREYSVCSYHAKEMKDDPRIVHRERYKR
jgi:hypothetical protein